MRNLNVLSENKIRIRKVLVHNLVKLLRSELDFKINQLQIIFVDSSYIHAINKEYLKHDYSTDIITFSYSEDKNIFDGEIYISVEDANQNSKKFKVDLNTEIIRLIIHGILHLLGFDDIDENDKAKMKKVENRLVKTYQKFDKQNIMVL
ncbi:MAG: rRNA maturation RNase YbeY [Bacteroidetes bacterium]|nr:rRNA maturation RNase YbeY [Bacteroidota bacterium]